MELPTTTWECLLLTRAYEAFHAPLPESRVDYETAACEEAYIYCARVIQANSRTFHLAASLLPKQKRRAVQALYAFCRATDDLIDKSQHPEEADRTLRN